MPVQPVLSNEITPGADRLKVYPWNTAGVAIQAVPQAWCDPEVVIPVDGVTVNYGYPSLPAGDLVPYTVKGFTLISDAQPQNATTWSCFRIHKGEDVVLDADSGSGQADAKKVFVADTSFFLSNDLIWVSDDDTPNGEIRRITGITVDTSLNCDTNFNNAYTTTQNATVYLIRRGVAGEHVACWGKIEAGGVHNMKTVVLVCGKTLDAGDGLLFRAYGTTVADPNHLFSVSVLYDDIRT